MEIIQKFQHFTNNFNSETAPILINDYKKSVILPISIYLSTCLVLKLVMIYIFNEKNKFLDPIYKTIDNILHYFSIIHNTILIIISSTTFYKICVVFVKVSIEKKSLISGFCDVEVSFFRKGETAFWIWVFVITKYYEFLDTPIRILKRKHIDFLHVYHHSTVVLHAFFCYYSEWSPMVLG
jgi:hypothetical protein